MKETEEDGFSSQGKEEEIRRKIKGIEEEGFSSEGKEEEMIPK